MMRIYNTSVLESTKKSSDSSGSRDGSLDQNANIRRPAQCCRPADRTNFTAFYRKYIHSASSAKSVTDSSTAPVNEDEFVDGDPFEPAADNSVFNGEADQSDTLKHLPRSTSSHPYTETENIDGRDGVVDCRRGSVLIRSISTASVTTDTVQHYDHARIADDRDASSGVRTLGDTANSSPEATSLDATETVYSGMLYVGSKIPSRAFSQLQRSVSMGQTGSELEKLGSVVSTTQSDTQK